MVGKPKGEDAASDKMGYKADVRMRPLGWEGANKKKDWGGGNQARWWKVVGDEVGKVASSQFTESRLSRGSRLNVLPGELGSLGRILSSGMPYCMSEEAEKHKYHQSGRMRLAVMNLGHPRRPGSQLEFHQALLKKINWHELKDNTVFFVSPWGNRRRVSTCGQLGQRKGWAAKSCASPLPPFSVSLPTCISSKDADLQSVPHQTFQRGLLRYVFSSVLKGSYLEWLLLDRSVSIVTTYSEEKQHMPGVCWLHGEMRRRAESGSPELGFMSSCALTVQLWENFSFVLDLYSFMCEMVKLGHRQY